MAGPLAGKRLPAPLGMMVDGDHVSGHRSDWATRMDRLNDVGRLKSSVGEADLARLLSLRGDESVLDLGSGTGFYTDRIAALTSGCVHALEIVPEMLAHYRERGLPGNVCLVEGDMTALSPDGMKADSAPAGALMPGSIDVAVTIATWHEIDGRLDVSGVARLLRPGGRLVVADWRKDPATWEYGPPENMRYATEEVTESLRTHFTIVSVEDVGPSMFAITARRR